MAARLPIAVGLVRYFWPVGHPPRYGVDGPGETRPSAMGVIGRTEIRDVALRPPALCGRAEGRVSCRTVGDIRWGYAGRPVAEVGGALAGAAFPHPKYT